jgi:hypothetical protein
MSATHEVLEIGPLEILPDEHLARAAGRPLMLSIRELRLLTELELHPPPSGSGTGSPPRRNRAQTGRSQLINTGAA